LAVRDSARLEQGLGLAAEPAGVRRVEDELVLVRHRAQSVGSAMAGSFKTEAVVLRSIRYAEADRVLHLYTAERGRVGAIAKGVRKTTSRVGGRLEPLGHVELVLHQGGGELHTVTGVELIRPHAATRDDP